MVAKMLMKPKFAKSQEKPIVRQRKVPNLMKNWSWHPNKGSDAKTDVHMPLKTGEPISENVSITRVSREP